MSELPEPLTPPECDLRDFPWMPVVVPQLTKSKAWSICKRRPELAFYMLNLWMASWHSVPAASLEDDDDVLCDAAMCDAKKWPQVREQVMRNWIKCTDGLLYHPVVAKEANASWESKVAQRARTKAATEARRRKHGTATNNGGGGNKNADDDVTLNVTKDVTNNATINVTSNVTTNATETLRSPPDQTRPDQTSNTSSLRSDGALPPPRDARDELWTDGLVTLRSLTGRADGPSRAFLGRLLRDLHDDCSGCLAILDQAADLRPGQPEAWLIAAAKHRSTSAQAPPAATRKQAEFDANQARIAELLGHAEPDFFAGSTIDGTLQ